MKPVKCLLDTRWRGQLHPGFQKRIFCHPVQSTAEGSHRKHAIGGAVDGLSLSLVSGEGLYHLPQGPGVYAVYDESIRCQHVGIARSLLSSVKVHRDQLGASLVHAVRIREVSSGTKEDLQSAWKALVTEVVAENGGELPASLQPGNATAWNARVTKPPPPRSPLDRVVAAATDTRPARPKLTWSDLRQRVTDHAHPGADSCLNADVIKLLDEQGFVVIDGALPDVDLARIGVEEMRSGGLFRSVHSQKGLGREDEIVVVHGVNSNSLRLGPSSASPPSPSEQQHAALLASPGCAAIAAIAALLNGLPHALEMVRQADASTPPGSPLSYPSWMPELGVPDSLMIACYPGEGAYYARHVDNDAIPPASEDLAWEAPVSPGTMASGPSWQGPPGQRVADRAVTAIFYLNEGWDGSSDGGQLRIHHKEGRVIPRPASSALASPEGTLGEDEGQEALPPPPPPPPAGLTFTDVEPIMGRLVLFDSREVSHEVLPAFKPRFALSAWIPAMAACRAE